jgi:hypothetical protein
MNRDKIPFFLKNISTNLPSAGYYYVETGCQVFG